MRKFFRTFILALLVVLAGAGCSASRVQDADVVDEIVFSRDILPLLQQDFAPLLADEAGLVLDSWSSLIRGSDYGGVLIPFDADRSLLVKLAERSESGEVSEENIELVRRWIERGAQDDDGSVPYEDADELLYVCNQGSSVISVIDMESNVVIRTIDLREFGFSENAKPHHAAVAPDGSHWFVSLIGENTVLNFNRDNELVSRLSFEVPGMLALDPSHQNLYVGRSMSAVNPPQRIGFVERGETDVEEIDVFYPRPHALQVTSDGRYVFSASLGVNQMATIDAESMETEIHQVPGPLHSLVQFAIAPDRQTMIAGGEMSGQLLFFDVSDPMNPTVIDSLQLGGSPWHPTFSLEGAVAYVPRKTADAVSVIDMGSRSERLEISGRGVSQPHGSAIRPDGRYVYVSNNNLDGDYTPRYDFGGDPPGTVVVIDTRTNEVAKVLEVESYPTGLGTRPIR